MDEQEQTLIRWPAVAFTGRLASLSRTAAAELVRAYEGELVAALTRRASMLVVGQEGLPLTKEGGRASPLGGSPAS
jgi:BRCT domain type II-containing protein